MDTITDVSTLVPLLSVIAGIIIGMQISIAIERYTRKKQGFA